MKSATFIGIMFDFGLSLCVPCDFYDWILASQPIADIYSILAIEYRMPRLVKCIIEALCVANKVNQKRGILNIISRVSAQDFDLEKRYL